LPGGYKGKSELVKPGMDFLLKENFTEELKLVGGSRSFENLGRNMEWGGKTVSRIFGKVLGKKMLRPVVSRCLVGRASNG